MCKPKSVKLSDRQIEKHVRENEPEHMAEVEQMIRNHEEIEDTLGEILRILGKLS